MTALEDFRKRRAAGAVRRKSKKKGIRGAGANAAPDADDESLPPVKGRPRRQVKFTCCLEGKDAG